MSEHTGWSAARRERGALESEVMAALWASGEPVTGAQVHAAVGADLNYKTVLTVLTRLCDKGIADRNRAGRAHLYFPVRARADLVAEQMNLALRHAGDRSAALQGFVAALDESDEAALRALLTDEL